MKHEVRMPIASHRGFDISFRIHDRCFVGASKNYNWEPCAKDYDGVVASINEYMERNLKFEPIPVIYAGYLNTIVGIDDKGWAVFESGEKEAFSMHALPHLRTPENLAKFNRRKELEAERERVDAEIDAVGDYDNELDWAQIRTIHTKRGW